MEVEEVPSFPSADEEAKYWKNLCYQYRKGMVDAREELDEFQEHSRELEQELEVQLEQADKRNQELRTITCRLQQENENYKDRVEQMQQEYNSQLTALETELKAHRTREEEWHKYIRDLEQSNDELERSQRVMLASVEDFEGKLNLAIERNAFLESELDEKESLRTMVQRLKDEARDLKQELKIRDRRETPDSENKKNLELTRSTIDCSKLIKFETQTPTGSPFKPTQQNGTVSPALTPSARISALNIVGDLLRGVSTFESKVAHARTLAREPSLSGESPRYRRNRPASITPVTPSTPKSTAAINNNNNNNETSSPHSSSPLIRA